MKKFLICLIVSCSFLLVSDGVSAKELSQFCDYTEPCFSTEILEQLMEENNLDPSFYNSYIVRLSKSSDNTYLNIFFFNYDDMVNHKIYVSNGNIHMSAYTNMSHIYYSKYYNQKIDFDKDNYSYFNYTDYTYNQFSSIYDEDNISLIYNVDLLDESGNIVFPKNDDNIWNSQNYEYPKQSGSSDKLYSIDYTFSQDTYKENTKIQYEIDYNDSHDKYSESNIDNYLYIDNFMFYGLVNDNGLYHYEKLGTQSNNYIDDYVESYSNGKYYLDINQLNLDFTNYEKIIMRAQFFTDENLDSFITRSNNEKLSNNDIFYNTVFGANYLNIFLNTEESLYFDISTDLDVYNSKFYAWGFDKIDPYKQPYILYFDTSTSMFISETGFYGIYYANALGYDFLNEFRDFEIGKTSKKAIAVTRELSNNSNVNFTYNLVFDYRGLYFSYNNTKSHINKIFINENGNWYQDNGIPAYNTNTGSVDYDFIKETTTNTLQNLTNTMSQFKTSIEIFFNRLPDGIKTALFVIFIYFLCAGVVKLIL